MLLVPGKYTLRHSFTTEVSVIPRIVIPIKTDSLRDSPSIFGMNPLYLAFSRNSEDMYMDVLTAVPVNTVNHHSNDNRKEDQTQRFLEKNLETMAARP